MVHDTLRVLMIDGSPDAAELLLNELRRGGHAVRPRLIKARDAFEKALDEHVFDIILTVPQVGSFIAGDVLHVLENKDRDIPLIVIHEGGDDLESFRIEIMGQGARDVVLRSSPKHILLAVNRELENLYERRNRRRAEHALHESQKRYKALFGESKEAVAYILDGMHIHANQAYLDEFGYATVEDLESIPVLDLIALDHQADFKTFMRDLMKNPEFPVEKKLFGKTAGDEEFEVAMKFTEATYDGEECLQLTIKSRDVDTESVQKLDLMSKQDQTSGLYNRAFFMDKLGDAISNALENEKRSTLLYIRLDTYETVKDTVGPSGADQLIGNIGQLLRDHTPQGSTLARYGDDIFGVLLQSGMKQAEAQAEDIVTAIAKHITEAAGQSVATTCSIGITRINESVAGVDDVLTCVANAQQTAHKNGGNRLHIYDPATDMPEETTIEGDAAAEIRAAISEHRLSLVYQPIVSLQDDHTPMYEVLLRMTDRDGETIAGKALFKAAATANLVVELDKWVIHNALQVLKTEHAAGRATNMFIKLSDAAIQDEKTLLFLNKLLKVTGVKGEHLTFEISETSAVGQIKSAKAYTMGLNRIGCKTTLEHFGSGLNSLSILNHLDVDYLKIDSSIIAALADDEEALQQVREIQEKANELGKITIAAAVEDMNTLTILWQCGVHCAQGNAIQEPSDKLEFDFSGGEEATATMF